MNPFQVLILGDDDVANSLRQILQKQGFIVYCAANLDEALSCVRESPPSCLILADVIFSGVSFWEAISQIRAAIGEIVAILIWRKNATSHFIESTATPYISVQKDKRVVFWASHSGDLPGVNGVPGSHDGEMYDPVNPAELVRFVKKLVSAECSAK